ncbi:MAG: TonB-dependent receptor plug domain-containing protein, partial [Bacteroidetes bacterium]|nr:TonB-dependent receptor plug domain-containing protein [Bacteroidota bacterium]
MRKTLLFFAGLIFQSLLYSQQVLDKETSIPISGVKIMQGESSEAINYTDTFGGFAIKQKWNKETVICFQKEQYEPLCIKLEEISKSAYIYMSKSQVNLEGVVVKAIRQNVNPTNTNYSLNEIKQLNNIRDIPMMLSLTPNAVSTSDAGNGVGYTGLRIRGVDPTRTNITINGIPLNDAESQGVYFVNMPDFASNLASIQIQRGLGNSTNGAGAFGSTINMQTNEAQEKASSSFSLGGGYILPEKVPYVQYSGSRTSALSNVLVNTGNINNWYVTGRLSYIKSDGYVDRSQSQLQSYYLSMVKKYKKSLIKILNFSGKEKTGQAWNGIPEEILFSNHSLSYQPNRIYNVFTYPNQTDNYNQSHYQIHFNHEF